MQQMIANVKVEISQELHAEEIRQLLKENENMQHQTNYQNDVISKEPDAFEIPA
jgi:hypothetical protein